MKRISVIAMIVLLFVLNISAQEVIIVESRQGGQNFQWYSEISGRWFDSVAKSSALGTTYDIGSRFITINGVSEEGEAQFAPEIPAAGKYDIYVTWGNSGNSKNVKYTVEYDSKQDVKYLNQAGWGGDLPQNSNEWHKLGTYELKAGKSVTVKVQSDEVTGVPSPENSGRVYADAVKFAPEGAEPDATPKNFTQQTPAPANTPLYPSTPAPQNNQPSTMSPFIPIGTPAPYQGAPVSSQPTPVQTTPAFSQTSPFTRRTPAQQTPSSMLGTEPVWYNDYQRAIQTGRSAGKSILLFFRSEQGQASRKMEDEILQDQKVKNYLVQNYITCKIDIASNKDLSNYYNVFKAPVLIFLDSRGYTRARIDQTVTPPQLIEVLEKYK